MPNTPLKSSSLLILLAGCLSLLPVSLQAQAQTYDETGRCTYYGDEFHGRGTSSGEKYDKDLFTAAHKTLPFNTLVKVTNLRNNKSVVVRINDRGPYHGLIDLSKAAARSIEMLRSGAVTARVEYVGMANADSVAQFLADRKKIKAEVAEQEKKSATDKTKKPEPKKPSVVTLSHLSPGSFYNQDYKACNPGGYGVQVGYYKSLSNCRNAMHLYEGKYSVKAFMYVEKKPDGSYYRLILGQFKNTASAEDFKKVLTEEIPKCFIVSYSSL